MYHYYISYFPSLSTQQIAMKYKETALREISARRLHFSSLKKMQQPFQQFPCFPCQLQEKKERTIFRSPSPVWIYAEGA